MSSHRKPRPLVVLRCLACLLVLSIQVPGVRAAGPDDEEIRPGDLVITLDPKISDPELERLIARFGERQDVTITAVYRKALRGFAGNFSDAAQAELARDPWVVDIEPDLALEVPPDLIPAPPPPPDPTAARGLDRIDQRDLPLDDEFHASLTGAGVNVYIIDSGIRVTHEDFGGRADGVFSAINQPADEDCIGHGTIVASVAGGSQYGVAKRANLHSVRVARCRLLRTSRVVQAIDWVAANHQRPAVANLSAGTAGLHRGLRDAARGLVAAGVPLVVASGNGDRHGVPWDACEVTPANANEAITVGGSLLDDSFYSLSSFGPCIDLVAPATATHAQNGSDTDSGSRGGTSISAPFVTGVVALMLEADPSLTPAEISELLRVSATTGRLTDVPADTTDRLLYAYFPQPHGARPWRIGDFNGDGKDDLVREAAGRGAGVLLSSGSQFLADGYWTNVDGGLSGYLVGDFDGDGKDDLARVPSAGNRIEVLLARNGFFHFQGTWLAGTALGVLPFRVGDFTGDGRADLLRVVPVSGRERFEVFASAGTHFLAGTVWLDTTPRPAGFHIGDFNGDGKVDVGRSLAPLFGVEILASNGSAFQSPPGTVLGVSLPPTVRVRIGDFDANGSDDFLIQDGTCTRTFQTGPASNLSVCRSETDPGSEGWYVGSFDPGPGDDILHSRRLAIGAAVEATPGLFFIPQRDFAFEELH